MILPENGKAVADIRPNFFSQIAEYPPQTDDQDWESETGDTSFEFGQNQHSAGSELLSQVKSVIRKYIVLSDAQATALAVFVAYTYAKDAFDYAPYIQITSAEKQCGKSLLMEVLDLIVNSSWLTGRTSAAALVRQLDAEHSVLLLDESDAAFSADKAYAEALRGALNNGIRRNTPYSMCTGEDHKVTKFDVFGPKIIAGIGKLPDTVASRSIPIKLERKSRNEQVERFRRKKAKPIADAIRLKLMTWLSGERLKALSEAEPELPDALSDRQQDVAEPLLALADLAGGNWPAVTRAALAQLWGGAEAEDDSEGVRLLSDIKSIFDSMKADKIPTLDLLNRLWQIDTSNWQDYSYGRSLNPQGLARILKPFEIYPRNNRLGATVGKGYCRADFTEAWERYLRVTVQ